MTAGSAGNRMNQVVVPSSRRSEKINSGWDNPARLSEGLYAVSNWDGHPDFDLHVRPTGVDSRDRELYMASFARIR